MKVIELKKVEKIYNDSEKIRYLRNHPHHVSINLQPTVPTLYTEMSLHLTSLSLPTYKRKIMPLPPSLFHNADAIVWRIL